MAQDNFAIVASLTKAGLLSKHEREEISREHRREKAFREKNANNDRFYFEERDWSFYPLQVLARAKMYSTSGTLSLTFSPAKVEIKPGQEGVYRKRLSDFAQKIFAAKLVSSNTLSETLLKVDQLSLRSEYEVVVYMVHCSEVEYFLQPRWYKKFADSLLVRKLLSQESYDTVMKKLENGHFRNYDEVYPYLERFHCVDLKTLPADPLAFVEAVHRATAKGFPELSFDTISVTVVPNERESFEDFKTYDAKVVITKNGKRYLHKSYHKSEYKNKKPTDDRYPFDAQSFHQVFNKMLINQGAAYRLHIVAMTDSRFGVLPLTKNQFEGLIWYYTGMQNGGYINLGYEDFNQKNSSDKLSTALAFYDSIGLLSAYTKAEKDSILEEALAGDVKAYSDLLSLFPKMVFEIDLEYGVNKDMYRKVTEEIATVSRGHFAPKAIVDEYHNKNRSSSFSYGFTLNGNHYQTKLTQEDDWLDPAFWELIEKAVAEQDKVGRFYTIHPNDGLRVVYLTHEQYKLLKDQNLLEFEPEE